MMDSCKLCLQIKNLRQSHIIPEFIYKPLYSSKHKMIEIKEGLPGLLQKGYREALLCQDCENHLNVNFEHPSVEIWRALTSQKASRIITVRELRDNGKNRALIFNGIDYSTFKLFLLSIIWRVSVSKHSYFQHVNLGHHEEKIRKMLLSVNPGKHYDYPCVIHLLNGSAFTPIYIPPKASPRYEGHRSFRILLTNVMIWYVISSHSAQADISSLSIKENGSLVATILSPKEVALLRNVIDATKNANIPDYMFK